MNVLLLGGYGQFGLPTAKQLARYDLVEKITIAGRNLERAQEAAGEAGPKAQPLALDAEDGEAVADALQPGDVLVSFMWDQERYQEPLIRAAIQAGA
ncbi:MAG: saccharopine dehydrogenase NADP-binding domain-containing protein, partial [Chloroflexota bacterium]